MTEQPINLAGQPDDITTFMGPLDPPEYELRRRIRHFRNAASYKVTQTESASARTLCWIATEAATAWIYAPADLDMLESVAKFLRRLLILADHAEEIGAP